jgi:hypothetical protein
MKMSDELFNELNSACCRLMINKPHMREEYAARGLSTTRLQWDMLWASGFPVNKLYAAGLNDHHINTALRRIVLEWFVYIPSPQGAAISLLDAQYIPTQHHSTNDMRKHGWGFRVYYSPEPFGVATSFWIVPGTIEAE